MPLDIKIGEKEYVRTVVQTKNGNKWKVDLSLHDRLGNGVWYWNIYDGRVRSVENLKSGEVNAQGFGSLLPWAFSDSRFSLVLTVKARNYAGMFRY